MYPYASVGLSEAVFATLESTCRTIRDAFIIVFKEVFKELIAPANCSRAGKTH